MRLPEQNAQGGLHLHHHSINRKHWYPGKRVAYNEMTLQNTQIWTTHKQNLHVSYMEYGEPMWFEADIN